MSVVKSYFTLNIDVSCQVIFDTKHRYQLSMIQQGKYKVLYFIDTEAVLKAK
jgi:hypothetical protein